MQCPAITKKHKQCSLQCSKKPEHRPDRCHRHQNATDLIDQVSPEPMAWAPAVPRESAIVWPPAPALPVPPVFSQPTWEQESACNPEYASPSEHTWVDAPLQVSRASMSMEPIPHTPTMPSRSTKSPTPTILPRSTRPTMDAAPVQHPLPSSGINPTGTENSFISVGDVSKMMEDMSIALEKRFAEDIKKLALSTKKDMQKMSKRNSLCEKDAAENEALREQVKGAAERIQSLEDEVGSLTRRLATIDQVRKVTFATNANSPFSSPFHEPSSLGRPINPAPGTKPALKKPNSSRPSTPQSPTKWLSNNPFRASQAVGSLMPPPYPTTPPLLVSHPYSPLRASATVPPNPSSHSLPIPLPYPSSPTLLTKKLQLSQNHLPRSREATSAPPTENDIPLYPHLDAMHSNPVIKTEEGYY